jgi:CelD/BcsL family acetyltransferase involved in cellulose biosynthesis
VNIEIITELEKFRALRSDWNELLDSSEERDNVFLRHEFIDAWFEAFGASKRMFVVLCYHDHELAGSAPLMLLPDRYKAFKYKRLGFMEDANAPSMNIISRIGSEGQVVEAIITFLVREVSTLWDLALLNKVPITASSFSIFLNCLRKHKIRHIVRSSMDSPFIETNGQYETFLQTTSPKFRKQLRNKINRLSQQGKVEILVFDNVGENGRHLEDAMSASSRSWKHRGKTSMTGTPERESFFRKLSCIAQEQGWLRLWILRLDGRVIAMEYHLEFRGITHAMRGDFDEAYEHLSPGSVLEAAIIEHCFSHALKEYDFCGLPYGYKVRWSRRLHERRNILFYPARGYAMLLYIAQKYGPKLNRIRLNCSRILKERKLEDLGPATLIC